MPCVRKQSRSSPIYPSLSAEELREAQFMVIRHVQESAFSRELLELKTHKQLISKSSLASLAPFIDEKAVLRVEGRIKNSSTNFNVKFPIILPKTSNISLLIIRYFHETFLHAGVDNTFALIRQQFWIQGSRNMVRKVVFNCIPCFKLRKTTTTQLMGDLPVPRVTANRAFLHCGLDYAGPVSIKMSKGRKPKIGKAWFAIFVCLSTKAIHIELVSDLTVDAFLASFRRFIARRGKPSDMYSDNATTFHGASRMLANMQEVAISQSVMTEVRSSLANDGVNWHFIPPSAPHFGGLWETGVRSIKLHLRRVVGDCLLTFEEYYTVLTHIESLLNSRPVCANSDTDTDPLTPSHFLIGEPYTCIPEPNLLTLEPSRLLQWRALQAKVQGFWKRWHMEYITSLQQRNKWIQTKPNIQVGSVVILKEPNLPPAKWVYGKIVEVHKGDDNQVRVVTVKTAKGEYKRPITKIAVLPIN